MLRVSFVLTAITALVAFHTGGTADDVSEEAAQKSSLPVVAVRHIAMATDFELIIYGNYEDEDPEALREYGREAFAAVDRLEDEISIWRPGSAASRINRDAETCPVKVPSDMITLLQESQKFYDLTGGVFDVTVGPLLELWGFYRKEGKLPGEAVLEKTLASIGLKYVHLNREESTVFFERTGMRVDFGGIGKGMALDRAAAVLRHQGIKNARLNGGSSTIIGLGAPPGKTGWTVDISSPYNSDAGSSFATVTIKDEAMSTSSASERYLEIDNVRYGHILDPRTGWPVANGVISATAIVPEGLASDALSTAFFVMGEEAVRTFCNIHKEVRCVLLVESGAETKVLFFNFEDEHVKETR
jgi:thiamine biosynthesis lipoprotein